MQPALRGRYYVRFAARVTPGIAAERLRGALEVLLARHAMLRNRFAEIDGQIMQCAQPQVPVPLTVHEVADIDDSAFVERVQADSMQPFDESVAPLIRANLYRAGPEACVLLLVFDHLVCDAWSMWQLMDELAELLEQPEVAQQPSPASQFHDFVAGQKAWLDGAQGQRQLEYWRGVLAEPYPALALAYDRQEPETRDTLSATLDAAITARLNQLAKRHGASLFATLLASHFVLLHRLTGQRQLSVGSPMPARSSEWAETVSTFSNPVVLRAQIEPDLDVAGLLLQLRPVVWRALKNQAYPLAELVERLSPQRADFGQPYFQSLFVFQKARQAFETLGLMTRMPGTPNVHWGEFELSAFGRWQSGGGVGMDLLFETAEVGDRVFMAIEYDAGKFDRSTIERYLGYWQQLLHSMVAGDTQLISALPMVPEHERRRLLQHSAARTTYASEHCVHELFERQVDRTPRAVAVEFAGRQLSYDELNQRANRLAHHLRSLGVGPDTRVALCVERSAEMVMALLAVLKAGGGYVPLDPAYPQERLTFMLTDSAPQVLLVDRVGHAVLGDCAAGLTLVDLEREHSWSGQPLTNPDRPVGLTPAQLAYVIYTSGSTGTPKGVMIEHGNVVRLFAATAAWFDFDSSDVWSLFHSYAFDFSVWEIWGALLHGGRLVVVPLETARNPDRFHELLCTRGITVLNQTPSAFRQLIEAQRTSAGSHALRCVVFGGEALDEAILRPWYAQACNHSTRLINMYGITETTVHVTYRPLQSDDVERRTGSVGAAIPDLAIYLLDAQGQPVPTGVTGEIYVGGAGVARGYLNRDELTAQRFLPDPFAAGPAARMYRSGDLGRWRADGSIEYLGRNDAQVKVRGFRIELGEIEAQLLRHPQIREAVVLARDDQAGDRRLVAYYVGEEASAESLRAHAAANLPHYMVPAAYVRLPALPLTPNGKLDRQALAAPGQEAYAQREYETPQGEVERALAGLWCELLQLERVSRHDHFFELGGHSLLAVRMIDRMRALGFAVDVRMLFSRPMLSALAETVSASQLVHVPDNLIPADCQALTPELLPLVALSQPEIDRIVASVAGGAANVQDIYPLTALQEGILFHHMLEHEEDVYMLRTLLRFDTRARLERFIELLDDAIARHDILRTAVLWEDLAQPVQVVWRRAQLSVEAVALDAGSDAAEQMRELFATYRLDVRCAPLQRAFIAHDARTDRWLLLLVSHHIVADHGTLEELLEEMQASLLGQQRAVQPSLPFRNFVASSRQGSVAAQEDFFRQMLGSVSEPTLPFGVERLRDGGRDMQRADKVLDAAFGARLRASARALGVSAASLFHLAWAQLLARASGREQVVFGTVLSGRMQSGSLRTAGLFINTLPICINVDDGTVEAQVRDTHACLAELLRHEHASLVLAQRCSGVPTSAPLFSALLNYRQSSRKGLSELRWEGMEVLWNEERSNYPLTLSVDDLGQEFLLTALVQDSVGAERICTFMATTLEHLVHALEQAPATAVRTLAVMPDSERQQLQQWNAVSAQVAPAHEFVHQWFEAQVQRTPHAVALELDGRQLSYADLNRQANALAHHLRSLGVGPDTCVALCVERSFAMVMSVLAVLKAGGGYVPMDPEYPAERLQWMLDDSAPLAMVTDGSSSALQQCKHAVTVIDLRDAQRWADQPHTDPDPHAVGLTSRHLAYVIYTSGSTGKPKGVMVEHGNVTRLFTATDAWFEFKPSDVWTLFHSYAFDFSVWELWGALLYGARLVIVPLDVARDPPTFHRLVCRAGVTVLNQTPSAFRQLIGAQAESPQKHRLRYVIFGGEALDTDALRPWYEQSHNRDTLLVNMYGITEITVHATYKALQTTDALCGNASIGRRIPDLQTYILDARGEPVPIGVPGEIYIGGAGVARGYLNRPELTAQRFIKDSFNAHPAARLYRTGDLGRWRADGEIDYLGRNDEQVKIRGFRIELGEIEAQLRRHGEIRDVVVVARADGATEKRLVAYYVSEQDLSAEALRTQVAAGLPHYMVPAAYVRLPSLPLTSNGKLDRKALPAPQGQSYAQAGYEAPQGEMETVLAELWLQLLAIERVGRDDNFFELGGHSLLAVRLVQAIKAQLGVDLSITDVFEYPELARLAGRLTDVLLEQFDPAELDALEELQNMR